MGDGIPTIPTVPRVATAKRNDTAGLSIHLCLGIWSPHVGTVRRSGLCLAMDVLYGTWTHPPGLPTPIDGSVDIGRHTGTGRVVDGQEWSRRRPTR